MASFNTPVYNEDDFEPIGGSIKGGIVNEIISNGKQAIDSSRKTVRTGKKGKKILVETVPLHRL